MARDGTWNAGAYLLLGSGPAYPRQLCLSMWFPGVGRETLNSGVENIPDNEWVHLGATYENNTGIKL